MEKDLPKVKLLIADDDQQLCRHISQLANQNGFECRYTEDGAKALKIIQEWQPKFFLTDLMLPEINALELLKQMKSKIADCETKTMVMSGQTHKFNIKQAMEMGAIDYIVKPLDVRSLFQRLIFHCRDLKKLKVYNQEDLNRKDETYRMLYLTDLILQQAHKNIPSRQILFNLTRMLNMKVDGFRTNVIKYEAEDEGYVVVSSDDPTACGIRLDLNKYPEVLHVVHTEESIAIENLKQNEMLKSVMQHLEQVKFSSMIVSPITRSGQVFGVLAVRMGDGELTITDSEIRFTEIVARTLGLFLSTQNCLDSGEFWKAA